MKLLKSIKLIGGALLFSSGVLMTSCDFLDIVPPEQVGMDDTVKDANETEDFLYSCYANVNNPIQYRNVEASADEFATPQAWGELQHKIAYDLLIPISETPQDWNLCYKYIGQTLLFLEYLPKAQGITEQQRAEYEAEAYFLLAYYHFQVLRMYGPCPITDKRIDPETPSSQYNGRFHYDAVTNWIVKTLDEKVIKGYNLPTERTENTRGRATHAIACALKARVLVYAASPLWNGGFPYKDWRNKISTSLDGVDYGTELVSLTYDPQKWERARVACEEALKEARIAGHKLYEDLEMYDRQNISLSNIYIPGGATDEFKKWVLMLRYLTSSRYNEGNTEYIWGVSKDDGYAPDCMMPWRVLQKNDGNWVDGYNSYAPYLGSMEKFYTKDGKFLDTTQPDLLQRAGVDESRPDIINLAINREPRFYAWMAFDQGDWGTTTAEGKPVRLEMKDSQKQGLNPELHYRDRCETGFLSQKFVRPNRRYDRNGNVTNDRFQRPLIRMAELYLNLAECYAAQGNTPKALENLNKVHQRAGLPAITEADITESERTLTDWILNERFVEFYGEGHRFYDLRRYMVAPQYLSAGKREGLNAVEKMNPTFAEFNQRVKVNQPYKWSTRMYILPIIQSEIGKNTNLVQAPGY